MAKARTIEGMVISTGGLCASDSEQWEHVFFLCPWREVGGELHRKKLRVVMPAKGRSAVDKAGRFRGKLVAVPVSGVRAPTEKLPYGLAQGTFPPKVVKADGAMKAAIADHNRPRTVKHPALGTLKYLPDLDCLVGRCAVNAGRGELLVDLRDIDIDDTKAVAKVLAKADKMFTAVTAKWKTIVERVVDELLGTYNDAWNGGAPIGKAAFAKQLGLDAIDLSARDATVFLRTGRLFRGHVVEIRLGATGAVRAIGLAG